MTASDLAHHTCITYDSDMRSTVDLPPEVHRRVKLIAAQRNESLSNVIRDLAVRGLAALDDPERVVPSPITGFPTISSGRSFTADEIAELIDEDE